MTLTEAAAAAAVVLSVGLGSCLGTVLWQLRRNRIDTEAALDARWDAITEETIVRILDGAEQ